MNYFNNKKGYALLATVVVVGVISVIAIGLSKTTTTWLKLSSSAKGSQIAFYQSDTASECALYADYRGAILSEDGEILPTFDCGGERGMVVSGSVQNYTIEPVDGDRKTPCFRIEVQKDEDLVSTTLYARGYNICDMSDVRTVEREIEVNY